MIACDEQVGTGGQPFVIYKEAFSNSSVAELSLFVMLVQIANNRVLIGDLANGLFSGFHLDQRFSLLYALL